MKVEAADGAKFNDNKVRVGNSVQSAATIYYVIFTTTVALAKHALSW